MTQAAQPAASMSRIHDAFQAWTTVHGDKVALVDAQGSLTYGELGGVVDAVAQRLRDAGVRMCSGNDGIRDAWGPLNMPDMLLRAFLVAYRNNFRRDDELEMVLDIITQGGAEVMGDAAYGLAPGRSADFVLVDGENHVEAIIERPARNLVVKGGRIVARAGGCRV